MISHGAIYDELLELAIEKAWPGVEVSAVNAGISGNTTADGLRRLQKDALDPQARVARGVLVSQADLGNSGFFLPSCGD
ncbi:MAG: hypothetical protein HUU20_03115 [Pirellulales bacterium]|nr:hypothetical protein [Pirellulales bacterium]